MVKMKICREQSEKNHQKKGIAYEEQTAKLFSNHKDKRGGA